MAVALVKGTTVKSIDICDMIYVKKSEEKIFCNPFLKAKTLQNCWFSVLKVSFLVLTWMAFGEIE